MSKRIELPVLRLAGPGTRAPSLGGTGARIGMVTLGCDKNTVDSERIFARLAGTGARLQTGAANADVVVINTCGFIDVAKEESIETILDAVRLKQEGRIKAVIAIGCLVQRYKEELSAELPEVDAFLGLTEVGELEPLLRARGFLADEPQLLMERPLRLLSTSTPHTSYLKISEGCDHSCAFCAIPLMRGKHRSTPMDVLVAEAKELERNGVKELNLVSQDTTWYGRDLVRGVVVDDPDYFVGRSFDGMAGTTTAAPARRLAARGPRTGLLVELLKSLLRNTGIPWLRLFYMYPSGIQRELVDLMAREPRILPYLDMPLQHGSDRMLELMRRPERQQTIRERVRWLRDAIPDLALRTTLIVGFPGETDDDFAQLMDLLEEIRFDYVGAFTYSVEEGTRAASMPDSVPDELKRERLEQLLDLQRTITLENNEARIGSIAMTLIDKLDGDGAVARTRGQALEVDGIVQIEDAQGARPGDFVNVRLSATSGEDLTGSIV